MKKLLLSASALCALAALTVGPASSADLRMPAYRPAAVVAPLPTWTGFYAGVNGGYGWNAGGKDLYSNITADFPDFATDGEAFTTASQTTLTPKGGFGGFQFGYNWQVGAVVFGLEADFQWSNIKADQDFAVRSLADGGADDATNISRAETKLKQFGSLRGRLGYTWGPALLYGTGGIAFGQVRDRLTVITADPINSDPIEIVRPLISTHSIEKESAMLGYAVGGGLEYLLGYSWSLKAEYQYINLGRTELWVTSDNGEDHSESTLRLDHKYHTFRVGLNYKFGDVVAPVAFHK